MCDTVQRSKYVAIQRCLLSSRPVTLIHNDLKKTRVAATSPVPSVSYLRFTSASYYLVCAARREGSLLTFSSASCIIFTDTEKWRSTIRARHSDVPHKWKIWLLLGSRIQMLQSVASALSHLESSHGATIAGATSTLHILNGALSMTSSWSRRSMVTADGYFQRIYCLET